MSWDKPYVIFRLSEAGQFEEVFAESDFTKAKYLLTYIAEPGDVLCRTPAHPKHSGKSASPEYWSHKEQSGSVASGEGQWREGLKAKFDPVPEFPSEPKAG